MAAFCDQWSDDAIAVRDSRSRRTEQISAAVESQTLSQWEPIDEGYYEADVDFAEGVFGAEEEWHDEDTCGSGGQTLQTQNAPLDDLLIEAVIDLIDIDVDSFEKQPQMTFGNLVKKRAEVKVSSITPQKKKELVKAKDNEPNTLLEHAVVEAASRKGIPAASMIRMRWVG